MQCKQGLLAGLSRVSLLDPQTQHSRSRWGLRGSEPAGDTGHGEGHRCSGLECQQPRVHVPACPPLGFPAPLFPLAILTSLENLDMFTPDMDIVTSTQYFNVFFYFINF